VLRLSAPKSRRRMGLSGACVEGTAGKPGRGECCWRECSPCSHAFRRFLWPYAGGMEARSAMMPTGEKLVSNGTALSRSKGNGGEYCSTRGRGTLTPKASLTKMGEAAIFGARADCGNLSHARTSRAERNDRGMKRLPPQVFQVSANRFRQSLRQFCRGLPALTDSQSVSSRSPQRTPHCTFTSQSDNDERRRLR
jgi:hypothetical protein